MIKCIIIDDEPLAIQLLSSYLNKLENFELVDTFTNPLEAIPLITKNNIDLILLDIQMPELNGMDLARLVQGKSEIIFTTAYPVHAVEGFELKALDYLVKPINFERFLIAVNRIVEKQTPATSDSPVSKDYIFIKTELRLEKIKLNDIYYFKGMGDYCSVVLKDKKILTLENLKSFVEKLSQNNFIRVHKSYIISLDKIEYIERGKIKILNEFIPIGATYEQGFKDHVTF